MASSEPVQRVVLAWPYNDGTKVHAADTELTLPVLEAKRLLRAGLARPTSDDAKPTKPKTRRRPAKKAAPKPESTTEKEI